LVLGGNENGGVKFLYILQKANRRFLVGLDAANRVKFLAFGEHEQYKLYLDWTLREGLFSAGKKEG